MSEPIEREERLLPKPAPEIIMAFNGIYWRRWPDGMAPELGGIHAEPMLSMVPVSDDNDPVIGPFVVYRPVGWEDHDGTFHAYESGAS